MLASWVVALLILATNTAVSASPQDACDVVPETESIGESLVQVARNVMSANQESHATAAKVVISEPEAYTKDTKDKKAKVYESESAEEAVKQKHEKGEPKGKEQDDAEKGDEANAGKEAAATHNVAAEKAIVAQKAFAATAVAQKLAAQKAGEEMAARRQAKEAQKIYSDKAAVAQKAVTEKTAAEKLAAQKTEEEKIAREKAEAAQKVVAQKKTAAEKAVEEHAAAKKIAEEKVEVAKFARNKATEAQKGATEKAREAQKAAAEQAAAQKAVAKVAAPDMETPNSNDENKEEDATAESDEEEEAVATEDTDSFQMNHKKTLSLSASEASLASREAFTPQSDATLKRVKKKTRLEPATASGKPEAEEAAVKQVKREMSAVLKKTMQTRTKSDTNGASPIDKTPKKPATEKVIKTEAQHPIVKQEKHEKLVQPKPKIRTSLGGAAALGNAPMVSFSTKSTHSFHDVVGTGGAFLLTLEREPHRAGYALDHLRKVGIFPENFTATDAWGTPSRILDQGCNEGCTPVEAAIAHSHKRALEAAALRKETWTAIFEDDAVPVLTDGMSVTRWDEEFRNIWQQLPEGTKMVRLNWCMPAGEGQMVSPPIGDGEMMFTKVQPNGLCTAAYMVHKDFIPKLLGIFPCNCALDCCLNWKLFESPGPDGKFLHHTILVNLDMVGSPSFIKSTADRRGLDMHGVVMQAFNDLGSTLEPEALDRFNALLQTQAAQRQANM